MANEQFGEEFYQVDFSKVDNIPHGELLLKVSKIEPAISKAGNRELKVQLKVLDGEDGQFNGRVIFDDWMLETDAVFRTKQASKAYLGSVPKGPTAVMPQPFLEADPKWCLVEVRKGEGDYEGNDQARVKRYGIKPPTGAGAF